MTTVRFLSQDTTVFIRVSTLVDFMFSLGIKECTESNQFERDKLIQNYNRHSKVEINDILIPGEEPTKFMVGKLRCQNRD